MLNWITTIIMYMSGFVLVFEIYNVILDIKRDFSTSADIKNSLLKAGICLIIYILAFLAK